MKTATIVLRSAAAVAFAFFMSSASCDLFDKVDDVTFSVELEHTFHVNETAQGQNVSYSQFEVLDAADINSDFDKYKDHIKSVSVSSVTYKIQNVAQSDIIFTNGKAGFSAANATTATSVATLGVENIKAAENQVKNLNFDQAAIDQVANLLKSDKKVNVFLMGTFNHTPAQFDVVVTVKGSVTADAL
jgi:hypothetical protein